MKRAWNLLSGLLSLAMVGVVLVMLVLVFGAQGEQLQEAQQADTVVATLYTSPPDAYPPPQETVLVPPTGTPISGVYPAPPTRTSVPTDTPNPNATPQPTVTPFPTRGPAPDAAGMILYTSPDQQAILGLPVDAQGRKAAEAEPLPLSLDFEPILRPPSPDGRYLLLLRPVEPGGIPYVFDRQTQQLSPVFENHPIQEHIIGWPYGWHPDSRQVLFWSLDIAMWLVNAETGEFTVLTTMDGPVQGANISPNGQEVVFIAHSDSSYRTMWKVSTASDNVRPLFDLGGPSYVFGWSPSGSYILYAGEPSDYGEEDAAAGKPLPGGPLWVMDPEGQNRRPLSGPFIFGGGFEPEWSPDGQWIAFTGLDEGQRLGCAQSDSEDCRFEGTAIYIENVVTGELRRLASGIEPTWSPDGAMVAFLSSQSGAPEIWRIRIDGTDLQQLTSDAQPKRRVFWATTPDRR